MSRTAEDVLEFDTLRYLLWQRTTYAPNSARNDAARRWGSISAVVPGLEHIGQFRTRLICCRTRGQEILTHGTTDSSARLRKFRRNEEGQISRLCHPDRRERNRQRYLLVGLT